MGECQCKWLRIEAIKWEGVWNKQQQNGKRQCDFYVYSRDYKKTNRTQPCSWPTSHLGYYQCFRMGSKKLWWLLQNSLCTRDRRLFLIAPVSEELVAELSGFVSYCARLFASKQECNIECWGFFGVFLVHVKIFFKAWYVLLVNYLDYLFEIYWRMLVPGLGFFLNFMRWPFIFAF